MIKKIIASLACADQINLNKEIKNLIRAGIDTFHIDIMDGIYVNNYCFGTQIFDYLKEYKNIEIEAHLMVMDPFRKVDFFKDKFLHKISFHIESCSNPVQTILKIKGMGKKCGIALNAATHENAIKYLYEITDYFLIMTVEAGFSGQDFVPSTIEKIKNIRREIDEKDMSKDIYVDGHVDVETISILDKAGANIFIGGSGSLFKNGFFKEKNLKELRSKLKE